MDELGFAGKSFLTLDDITAEQTRGLLAMASRLKASRYRDREQTTGRLQGKQVALLFEKASTRTRCSAAVAAAEEGASVQYLGKDDIHLGKKESVADTARVLGRLFDGIMFRGYAQSTAEELSRCSGVPVWNGLTDECHPTQALADLQTVEEFFGTLRGAKVVYFGDGRNNVIRSLAAACARTGADIVNCCPPELSPGRQWLEKMNKVAAENDCSVDIVHDPGEAVKGANVVYTDVWASMGEEKKFRERVQLLRPYQVNGALVESAGTLASGDLIFLHCLPAFHNDQTAFTRDLGALEVSDEVFEADFSRVFEQAENRMHTIKAVMLATLA